MALNANALTTVATVKGAGYLNISVTTYDTWLEKQINIASQRIENYIGRKLYTRTITSEKYKGNNRSKLYLKNYPVASVTSVIQQENTISSGDYELVSSDYSAYLYNELGWWSNGITQGITKGIIDTYEDIKVTYVAGYVLPPAGTGITLPADIEEACIQSVIYAYNQIGSGGRTKQSEKLQSWSVTYADNEFDSKSGLLESVKSMLNSYREVTAI